MRAYNITYDNARTNGTHRNTVSNNITNPITHNMRNPGTKRRAIATYKFKYGGGGGDGGGSMGGGADTKHKQ